MNHLDAHVDGCTASSGPVPVQFVSAASTDFTRSGRYRDYRRGFSGALALPMSIRTLRLPVLELPLLAALILELITQQELPAALERAGLPAIPVSAVTPQVQVEWPLACEADLLS